MPMPQFESQYSLPRAGVFGLLAIGFVCLPI